MQRSGAIRYTSVVSLCAALVVGWSSMAAAQEEAAPTGEPVPGEQQEKSEEGNIVSITISPVHLVLPVFELMGEYRLQDKIGAAVIVGFGSIEIDPILGGPPTSFSIFEGGAQLQYYLLGNFDHGMQLGAEAVFVQVSGSVGTVTGLGQGLVAGPYIGYKVAADVGFTFNAQLGYQVGLISASAEDTSDGSSSSASGEESASGPLLNLNVGWSF